MQSCGGTLIRPLTLLYSPWKLKSYLSHTADTMKCRKLQLILVGGCMYATSCCDFGVTFGHGSARMFSNEMFDTYFSYHKGIWISATYNYMYVYLIMQYP